MLCNLKKLTNSICQNRCKLEKKFFFFLKKRDKVEMVHNYIIVFTRKFQTTICLMVPTIIKGIICLLQHERKIWKRPLPYRYAEIYVKNR